VDEVLLNSEQNDKVIAYEICCFLLWCSRTSFVGLRRKRRCYMYKSRH